MICRNEALQQQIRQLMTVKVKQFREVQEDRVDFINGQDRRFHTHLTLESCFSLITKDSQQLLLIKLL